MTLGFYRAKRDNRPFLDLAEIKGAATDEQA
jgi:hypothetical protein